MLNSHSLDLFLLLLFLRILVTHATRLIILFAWQLHPDILQIRPWFWILRRRSGEEIPMWALLECLKLISSEATTVDVIHCFFENLRICLHLRI